MISRRSARRALLAFAAFTLGGCATVEPYDYTRFRQSPPRSILILPPLNESTAVEGTYSYLSTVSQPVAERGYYVFPVAVVDQFLKENGMPTAGEMHGVPLDKVRQIVGADAVLLPTLHAYGSQFHLVSSDTTVRVSARLIDTRTGDLLWENTGFAQQGSGGTGTILGDIIAAAVTQAINANTDPARQVSRTANTVLFEQPKRALPFGPYHPEYGRTP